jgi:flagellar protein FliO/FliZ
VRILAPLLRPGRPAWALAAALLALALAPVGGLAGGAARALSLLGALGLAAAALRRQPSAGRILAVAARHPLGRDCGLAVVELPGRRVLVGWGAAGVALLADLPPQERP